MHCPKRGRDEFAVIKCTVALHAAANCCLTCPRTLLHHLPKRARKMFSLNMYMQRTSDVIILFVFAV